MHRASRLVSAYLRDTAGEQQWTDTDICGPSQQVRGAAPQLLVALLLELLEPSLARDGRYFPHTTMLNPVTGEATSGCQSAHPYADHHSRSIKASVLMEAPHGYRPRALRRS